MVWYLIELVFTTGAIGPAIIVAAYFLWNFGVREEFLLTILALLIGIPAGWLLNVTIGKLIPKRQPRKATLR
jgi:hypothetical protein